MASENELHAAVARQYAEQIKHGLVPDIGVAAHAIGYASGSASMVIKTNSFQKELFYVLPYHLLARLQHKQANAWRLQTVKVSLECDIKKLCEDNEFVLLDVRKSKNCQNVLIKIPDWETIDKALDKIYKLSGLYQAEKHELTRPLEEMSDEELLKLVNQDQGTIIAQPQAEILDTTVQKD